MRWVRDILVITVTLAVWVLILPVICVLYALDWDYVDNMNYNDYI